MERLELNELRAGIDKLDREIIALLAERYKLTETVGEYKAKHGLHAQDPEREAQQFRKITALASQYGLEPERAARIYRLIMDLAIARHQELQASV
ncbi:chorismate mutase [Paenibacillus methanolicus]|uniref:Chorismate mutase n=1 Tax=Paenibacillus methanolicus TaxID=582686 RepID=A0A5S5C7P3_9BACL|nr:chorismate mutase [Paenibacillus methanolicus]TYP75425.1 chorismate mutase [Paenibacillus methanolicus]